MLLRGDLELVRAGGEVAALERLWRKSHQGTGHGVTTLEAWRRAA